MIRFAKFEFIRSKTMAKIFLVLAAVCTTVSTAELPQGEVTVRFYTGTTPNYYTDYFIEAGEYAVTNSAWDSRKPVVIYIHGLAGSVQDQSTLTVVSAYLENASHNVLALNYPSRATITPNIIQNVALVGVALGKLIDRFLGAGVPLSSFHVIGFGLGPHVAANAARTLQGKISRITALDPALPGFYRPGVVHIEATDARIVDVIHTDSKILGVEQPIGTADFYPNRGYALQPGCVIGFNLRQLVCSTNRSWYYYAESVRNPGGFTAVSCNSWDEFKAGACRGVIDHLGYGYSEMTTGIFYLQTNSAAPFCRGDDGIVYDPNTHTGPDAGILGNIKSLISTIFG